MNNEEFNNESQVHTNKFIFSDDFYNDIPLEVKNDVTKPVEQFVPKKEEVKGFQDQMNNNIDQVSGLNDLINGSYNSSENNFNFFGHNSNVTEEVPVIEEQKPEIKVEEPIIEEPKEKNSIFSNIDLPFKKKEEKEEKIHIDLPEIQNDFTRPIEPIVEEPVIEEVKPELNPVNTEGLNENIIDNIVDYQPATIEVKKEEETETDQSVLMGEIGKPVNLDVQTGINEELEQQLLEQKAQEEEAKRLAGLEDYKKYAPIDENTELVYKAAGKSYIREKQPTMVTKSNNNKPSPVEPITNYEEEQAPSPIKEPQNIEEMIENILDIPNYDDMTVKINLQENPGFQLENKKDDKDIEATEETIVYDEKTDNFNYDQNFDNIEILKSELLDELRAKAQEENKISILARYGEDFCSKDYVTNPAIGRAEEIKQLILILLTPEKSAILTGKPGIGKTSIVEGLAYQLQRNNVPDALKGYRIVSVKTPSLLGSLPTGETRLQTLVDELKTLDKVILFIDEIHMLIGATSESSLDFANMFKESLGRGTIKVIGATTTEEYERYILRDKAFVRRFQKVEVEEPDRTHTIKILMGTLPKIEKNTGAKLKYTEFIQTEIMGFIVDITTEYKRIYGIGSRYPDICLTLLAQAFSQAVFANRTEVNIFDIRKAIENSKNIYPDVIKKELVNFDIKFKDIINEENRN